MSDTTDETVTTVPPDRMRRQWPTMPVSTYVNTPPPPPSAPWAHPYQPPPPPDPAQPPDYTNQPQTMSRAPWAAPTPNMQPRNVAGGQQTPYGYDPRPAPAWPAPYPRFNAMDPGNQRGPFFGITESMPVGPHGESPPYGILKYADPSQPGDARWYQPNPQVDARLQVIRARETGNRNIPNQQGPGGTALSSASGPYQIINDTWTGGKRLAGIPDDMYPNHPPSPGFPKGRSGAMDAPIEVQTAVARALYAQQGERPWAASANQRYMPSVQNPITAYRPPEQWGRPPVGGYGVGGGALPQTMGDFRQIMGLMAQTLPMMSGGGAFVQAAALNNFAQFVRGYQSGQEFQTRLHAEQYKQSMTELNDQLSLENRDIGAIVAAEQDDPDKMTQDLIAYANAHNDQMLAVAASHGIDAVKRLMQARDHVGSDASKADLAMSRLESQRLYQELQTLKIQQAQDPNSLQNREREARIKYIEEQIKQKQQKGAPSKYDPQGPPPERPEQPATDPTQGPAGPTTQDQSTEQPPGSDSGDSGDSGDGGDSGGGGGDSSATQAPAGPTQTAQAKPPAESTPQAPTDTAAARPYQEASTSPTPSPTTDQAVAADTSAIERGRWKKPDMPTFNRLPQQSQQIAREELQGDPNAMRNIPMNERQPLEFAAKELQGALNSIPPSFTGPEVMRAVRQIDPTLANTLGLVAQNRLGIPTGGRGTTNRAFWDTMANLAARVSPPGANGPTDPGWSADQYQQIDKFKDPHGNVQQTLLRVGTMATSAKQVLEGLSRMPPLGESSYARLYEQWKAGTLHGHSEFTTLLSNLYQFIQESQYLAAGRGLEGETQTMANIITPEQFKTMVMPSKETVRDFIKSHSETAESRLVGYRNMWSYNHGPGPMAGEQPQAQPILSAIAGMDINNGLFDAITPETESMLPDSLTDGKGQVWWYKGTGDRTDQGSYTLTPPATKSPATKWFQQ